LLRTPCLALCVSGAQHWSKEQESEEELPLEKALGLQAREFLGEFVLQNLPEHLFRK